MPLTSVNNQLVHLDAPAKKWRQYDLIWTSDSESTFSESAYEINIFFTPFFFVRTADKQGEHRTANTDNDKLDHLKHFRLPFNENRLLLPNECTIQKKQCQSPDRTLSCSHPSGPRYTSLYTNTNRKQCAAFTCHQST